MIGASLASVIPEYLQLLSVIGIYEEDGPHGVR